MNTVRDAIEFVDLWLFDGLQYYFADTCGRERVELEKEITQAYETLRKFGIGEAEVRKHHKRMFNKESEPIRFIDRIDILHKTYMDDLPF